MTDKTLSPLRRKDIETGRRLEREAIVDWLHETADVFKKERMASKKHDTSDLLHHEQSCTRAASAIEDGEHLK